MAAVPAHPWLPPLNPSAGGGVGPAHLITVASALRLGHHLRLRCCRHLHRLLVPPPSPLEDCYSDSQHRIKDVWWQGSHSQRSCSLPAAFAEGVSASLSFFSGKDFGHGSPDKGNDRFDPLRGNFSSKRMWTNVLLAVNVLVYIAQIATHGRLIFWGAKVNSLIDKGQLWRLATSSFLHANIGHLLMNSYSLNSIGPTVEQLSGPRRFLAVYFTSAIASSLMSYRFCQSPAVGASGAIFGLVGSFAVFVLRHRSIFGGGKQDLQQIARVIALNMVIGILSTGIDNWGHLGGLLGGAAISWFLGPAWRYQFKDNVGRAVFVDRAPIFSFTFINMRSLK